MNEEMRRLIVAETQEIEASIHATQKDVSDAITLTNNIGNTRQRYHNEVISLYSQSEEFVDGICVHQDILDGLQHTLYTEIVTPTHENILLQDGTPNLVSAMELHQNVDTAMHDSIWCDQARDAVEKDILEYVEAKEETVAEIEQVEERLASEQLKLSIANAKLHTTTAENQVKEETGRLHSLKSKVEQADERSTELEKEGQDLVRAKTTV